MSRRGSTRLAWLLFAGSAALSVLGIWLGFLNGYGEAADSVAVVVLAALPFPLIGALIATRHPTNAIGWIFSGVGVFQALNVSGFQYARYAIVTNPGSLPLGAAAGWFAFWTWMPSISLLVTFLLLLFPDGRLLSRRWRPVAWLACAGIGLVVVGAAGGAAALSGPELVSEDASNTPAIATFVVASGACFVLLAAVASVASLVLRFRRSQGEERLQLKWFALAGAFGFMSVAVQFLPAFEPSLWGDLLLGAGLLFIPVAAGIAILKHRLYDIDVVINKTVVFGALGFFISAVYITIVVGVGTIAGAAGKPNLTLSIAATAVVAVAFQPMRERVQRFANRLVYGERATPYEVLTRFSKSMATVVSVEDILPEIARHTAQGLGARRVRATVRLPAGERTASYPQGATSQGHVTETIPVTFQDAQVGEITITKGPSESLTAQERKLLEQLAAHSGVVLHNYTLAFELRQRLEELALQAEDLESSRARLVSVTDTSRRAIEQAIRQGVESRLIVIRRELQAAERVMKIDPSNAASLLDWLAAQTTETLEALRDLARGIYPPLLADKGLIVALEAHIRKIGLGTSMRIDEGLASKRFERAIEATGYFCIREALDNAARHAAGAPVRASIEDHGDHLTFSVADEGPGFDRNAVSFGQGLQSMADRLAAAGGELKVRSSPGRGTMVTGSLPLVRQEDDAAQVGLELAR